MKTSNWASLISAGFAAGLSCVVTAASAATPSESFVLGQSSMSGAVCQAVRSNSDPAAQIPRARAWIVNCRGWSDTPLGYIYVFPSDAPPASWRDALNKRAACQSAKAENLAGLRGATASECQTTVGKAPYTVYQYSDGGLIVAEGMTALSDVLQTGLKVAAGVQAPPAAAAQPSTTAISADAAESLAAAAAAAQNSPAYLRQRAYLLNQGWIFGTAEQDFRILATDPAASPRDRAEAQLIWALNVSNQARFADADSRFADAARLIQPLNDPQLDAQALTYRALHLMNQKKYAEAEQLGNQAIAIRAQLAPSDSGMAPALTVQQDASGEPVISAALASQLNEGGAFQTQIVSPVQRLQAQNAQSYYALGMARMGQGDLNGARQNLEQADRLLTATKLPISLAWQRAEVYRQLAAVELQARQPAMALMRLREAIAALQGTTLAGTPPEARLYVELGRVEAQSGNVDQALADFAAGLDRFRQTRGTVGNSADATASYFDLLLARAQADPARLRDYQSRYFDALQSIVSQATAQTIARLAERLNQSGGAGAGAARALEETERQIAIKTSEIQRRQESGNYPQEERATDQAQLKQLQDQRAADQQNLITANPRYGQLLTAAVTLDQMQAALNPGELYVKNILLDRGGYAIAVSKDAVRIFAIPLSRSAAAQAVTQLRRPFDATGGGLPRFDVVAAHNLYTTVFGPVQDVMPSVRHLIYDPDGALISLPVAALVTDDASVRGFQDRVAQFLRGQFNLDLYQNVAWLGRNTSITLAVAPSAFLQARNFAPSKAQYSFIGLGDPVTQGVNDPRMFRLVADPANGTNTPACEQIRVQMTTGFAPTKMEDMIRAVAGRLNARPQDIVLGQAFTDAGLLARKDMDNYKVVFFGTHGLLPTQEDCLPEPALVTSLGAGSSDAFLDASEILQLHLDADLVVLAACNTGGAGAAVADRTGLTGSGEALGGLARDFIYAGSRGLIVSQWEVNRDATVQFMQTLFDSSTATEADAMRRAEQGLMNNARFSHPFFWAAFSLVGDGMRPMPRN